MGALDLAGTIGTWIAVFLALFALVGVAGPFLVWRTSRTLRNQALINLDVGLAENGGFVSKGVSLTKTIRLFRQVKAPVLKKPPQVKGRVLAWDPKSTLPWNESASWVQFGAALKAYGIEFGVGDELLYTAEATTQLPLTPIWLLTIGLQARFGYRKDSGKLPRKAVKGIVSKQPRPGQAIHRDTTAHLHAQMINDMLTGRGHWADDYTHYGGEYNDRLGGPSRLSGLVGSLKFYHAPGISGVLTFMLHEQDRIGTLSGDTLDLSTQFWLSVGCLPVGDGRLLSLEDVQAVVGSASDPMEEPASSSQRRRRVSTYRDVHFADEHDDERGSEESFDQRSCRRRPSMYVDAPKRTRPRPSRDPQKPRRFCFAVTEERVEAMVDFAVALGAENEKVETLTLEELAVSDDDLAALEEDASRTYVPCDRSWIRLGPARNSERSPMPWFLERSDAQLLARALVQMPLCAHGYLIYNPTHSACRTLLVDASAALPRTLNYLMFDLELFQLEAKVQKMLLESISRLYSLISRFSYSRSFADSLFELDEMLLDVVKCPEWIKVFVQAVVLTSPEFRDLVHQSLRNVKECLQSNVVIEIKDATATLEVVAAFGLVQKFPIDSDVLLERDELAKIAGRHTVPYPDMLMIFTKAVLRSAFLRTSLDSMPLWEIVLSTEEILIDGRSPSIYTR